MFDSRYSLSSIAGSAFEIVSESFFKFHTEMGELAILIQLFKGEKVSLNDVATASLASTTSRLATPHTPQTGL